MFIGLNCWRPEEIPERLSSARDITGVVLFNYYEWEYTSIGNNPGFEGIVDYVNERNIPFYVITGGCREIGPLHDITNRRYRNVQPIIYWETFWMLKTYIDFNRNPNVLDINDSQVGLNYTNFKYKFISLNNRTHYHRCCLLDRISKNNLFEDGKISFHWYDENSDSRTNCYRFKHWVPKMLTIDQSPNIEADFFGYGKIPVEFTQSFMQVISESSSAHHIISEKTATPLFYNKPFLVSGPKGFHKMLDRLGFVKYDEIFDYSFDDVDDLETRIDMLLQNVIKIRDYSVEDLVELHHKLTPKLLYNKSKIHELAFNKKYVPEFLINLVGSDNDLLSADPNFKELFGNIKEN